MTPFRKRLLAGLAISVVAHLVIILVLKSIVVEREPPPTTVILTAEVAPPSEAVALAPPEKSDPVAMLTPPDRTPAALFASLPPRDNYPGLADPGEARDPGRENGLDPSATGAGAGRFGTGGGSGAGGKLSDVMGAGGSGPEGAGFGWRVGNGKLGRAQAGGGGADTENAVTLGLEWLARHQEPDGSWSPENFFRHCAPPPRCQGQGMERVRIGVSGLALLAFLGAGHTLGEGRFQEQVRKGLHYLVTQQDPEGCVGTKGAQDYVYGHAIAALALSEAWAMTANPLLKEPAGKAARFAESVRNRYQAWGYAVTSPGRQLDSDTSVTGWMIMALKSARAGGLEVSDGGLLAGWRWVEEMTDKSTGQVYYGKDDQGGLIPCTAIDTAGPSAPAAGEKYARVSRSRFTMTHAMTAIGLLTRIWVGEAVKEKKCRQDDPLLVKAAGLLQQNPPAWNIRDGEHAVDYYYWYYGALAVYQMGGEGWVTWNNALKEVLLKHQKTDGCLRGSWPTEGRWCPIGGRIYATAMAVLTLEVYYRYARVFK